jgi:hypothetical protein
VACTVLYWSSELREDVGQVLLRPETAVAQLVATHLCILHDFVLPYSSKGRCAGDAGRRTWPHHCLNILTQALNIPVDETLDVELGVEIQHRV